MAIKIRNKRSADFNMASMADLVFLLLIFFMLTSTLVSPSAIKLLLPSSTSDRTLAPNQIITVYINDAFNYYIEKTLVNEEELENAFFNLLTGQEEGTVVLRSDASVPVQYIVNVIDAVNTINRQYNTKHRVILATKPK